MPVSRSAGIILFRDAPEGAKPDASSRVAQSRRYLILRASREDPAKKEFWDIPKGELNPGEDGLQAALREAREETGIEKFDIVSVFKFTARYFTKRDGKTIPKFVAVFLAKTTEIDVRLSWEHDMYLWTSFEEARSRLTTMRPALEAAEKFLENS